MTTVRISLHDTIVTLVNPDPAQITDSVLQIVSAAEAKGLDTRALRVQTLPDLLVPSELTAAVAAENAMESAIDAAAASILGPDVCPSEEQRSMLRTNLSDVSQGYSPAYSADEIKAASETIYMDATDTTESLQIKSSREQTVDEQIPGGEHDTNGELRSLADLDIARRAGFAPKPTVFRRGTRVVSLGVQNARKSREQFERMPEVAAGVAEFIKAIEAEERYERVVPLTDLRMDLEGRLSAPGAFAETPMEEPAFAQYASTLAHECGLKSGSSFLGSMTGDGPVGVKLRAYNIEMMRSAISDAETAELERSIKARETARAQLEAGFDGVKVGDVFEPKTVKVRARKNGVFALVGPEYPCFDADKVAAAIAKMHKREGMRIDTNYNGRKARWDIIAQTPVKPELFVAGEFFRVGYRITTSDDGKGAIKISILLWQNLCLNLIVLDKGVVEIAAIRHKGDVTRLARELDAALIKAQSKIGELLDKWNYAVKAPISASTVTAAPGHKVPERLTNEELMAGVFRSLIDRDLIPVGARKAEEAVKALVSAYGIDSSAASVDPDSGDRRFTRASVVNAVTRVAHDEKFNTALDLDMDDEDMWERAGGRILDAKTPLLWIPSKADIKAANAAEIAAMLAKTA